MNEINELGDIEEVQTFVPGIPERAKTSLQVKASESLEFGAGVTVLPTQGRDVQTVGHDVPDKYGYQISGYDVNIFTTLESGVAKSYRMPSIAQQGGWMCQMLLVNVTIVRLHSLIRYILQYTSSQFMGNTNIPVILVTFKQIHPMI